MTTNHGNVQKRANCWRNACRALARAVSPSLARSSSALVVVTVLRPMAFMELMTDKGYRSAGSASTMWERSPLASSLTRKMGRRRSRPHLPMPVGLFERFVGTDLTTMWRWLHTARFDMPTQTTRQILPQARTGPQWLDETIARRGLRRSG